MKEKTYDEKFPVGYASFSVSETIGISLSDFNVAKTGYVGATAHIRIANTNRNNQHNSKDWEYYDIGQFRTFEQAMMACMKFANKKLHFKLDKTVYSTKTYGMARIGKRVRKERLDKLAMRRAALEKRKLQTA